MGLAPRIVEAMAEIDKDFHFVICGMRSKDL